jgi:hypothetical protein
MQDFLENNMDTYKGRPVVYLDVDSDLESRFAMDAVALVDQPATEMEWFAFAKETQYQFKTIDATKRMFTAIVMLADTPIERYDKRVGTYYTVFTPQAIEKMMRKYFMQNKIHQVNEMHQGSRFVEGVYMVESYQLTDRVQSTVFDVPQGTWIATFYVEDEAYWEENIASGKYSGISLEGSFDTLMSAEQTYKKWRSNPDSANVEKILYNDETKELVLRFHGGGTYTYPNIEFAEFRDIVEGNAPCVTDGTSRWGSWYVGKQPSVGAAVHKYLVKRNAAFIPGGSFYSRQDATYDAIKDILSSDIDDVQKYTQIQELVSNIQETI